MLENEVNFDQTSKDRMRNCMTELLKENENMKREKKFSTQELKRQQEKNAKLNSNLQRMTKTLKTIKSSRAYQEMAGADREPTSPGFELTNN